MATYQYFDSIVCLDFHHQYFTCLQAMWIDTRKPIQVSNQLFSKKFQQILLLLASKHYLVVAQGLALALFDDSPPVSENQLNDALFKLHEWRQLNDGLYLLIIGLSVYHEYKSLANHLIMFYRTNTLRLGSVTDYGATFINFFWVCSVLVY